VVIDGLNQSDILIYLLMQSQLEKPDLSFRHAPFSLSLSLSLSLCVCVFVGTALFSHVFFSNERDSAELREYKEKAAR
jgi:hypothetical protein